MEVVWIAIDRIFTGPRLRPASSPHVDDLAADMQERGMRSPIEVAKDPQSDGYLLVSGLHRLEAAKQLSWETVPAFIVEGTDAELKIDEILENLNRHELSRLDRCVFVAEYRRLMQMRDTAARRGGDRRSLDYIQSANDGTSIGWWEDLAEKSDRSRRTLMREGSIGEKIDSSVVQKLRETPIQNNLGELEQLSRLQPKQQRHVADMILQTENAIDNVGAAMRALERRRHKVALRSRDEVGFDRLMQQWRLATPQARKRFLVEIMGSDDPL